MTDIPSIDAKRWEKNTDPNSHKPSEALNAALRDIESGHLKPNHIIVVYCTDEGESGGTGYYQAGELNGYFAALGLLTRATQVMGQG